VCLSPAVEASYQPDAAEQALLAPRYAEFRQLYRAA
jgi:xylulokinase